MKGRKGIILAGGLGTRLYPITSGVSKQLLPVYDKPMIYYPLSVLMLTGISEIAIITTEQDQAQFVKLLSDGSQWGISLTFIIQPKPDGLAQSYILAESFLNDCPSVMILGDNIFFGHNLQELLFEANYRKIGATVFGYHVADPERYGVAYTDANDNIIKIVEKPTKPLFNTAVTGLYFMDSSAPKRAKNIKPSKRGELEITTLLETYLSDSTLKMKRLGRGYAWLDTGTCTSLLEAGNFVKAIQSRQGLQVGCPEEIAFQKNWIKSSDIRNLAKKYKSNGYGKYLMSLI